MRYRLYLIALEGNIYYATGQRYWVTSLYDTDDPQRFSWNGGLGYTDHTFSKCQADCWWSRVCGWNAGNSWRAVIEEA